MPRAPKSHQQHHNVYAALVKRAGDIVQYVIAVGVIACAGLFWKTSLQVDRLEQWKLRLDEPGSVLNSGLSQREWLLEKEIRDLKMEQLRGRIVVLEMRHGDD